MKFVAGKFVVDDHDVMNWEEMFGTDVLCPPGHEFEGLPYWVEYMPHDLLDEYLNIVDKREFVPYDH